MPRPPKCRRIEGAPKVSYFKPRGVPLRELTEVYLSFEGLEAIRLADREGLTMEEAAARMHVSRHTFGRILAEARAGVAEALVEGRALRIEGGTYTLARGEDTPAQPEPAEEVFMSKIAVTSEGPALTDRVDPRFGRAAGFVVVDLDTAATTWIDNGSSQALAHGAGIQAAQLIARAGAGVLLTGFVGPKAFTALAAAGVKVGQNVENVTVAEAVELYKAGRISFADGPNR